MDTKVFDIKKHWSEFRKVCLPHNLPEEAYQNYRSTFYVGLLVSRAFYKAMFKMDLSDDQIKEVLGEIDKELDEFMNAEE